MLTVLPSKETFLFPNTQHTKANRQVKMQRIEIERAMSASHRRVEVGETIMFVPASERHTATVILCHGLGDSASGGLSDVVEGMWSPRLPWVKFILPTAPVIPVTLNGGMPMPAWYDIVGLDLRSAEMCDGIAGSRETVMRLVAAENEAGIPCSRIVLAGFSQGGALSLYTGTQHPEAFAGVVVLSGYLPCPGSLAVTGPAKATPIAMFHGDADPLVLPPMAAMSKTALGAMGFTVTLQTYKGVGHSMGMQEIADVVAELSTRLPRA